MILHVDEEVGVKNMGTAASLPQTAAYWGNSRLSEKPLTALSCYNRCPSDRIRKTCDLARAMRDAGTPVIGGFQTPMEKECLRLLLWVSQPVVVCPARVIDNMPPPPRLAPPYGRGPLARAIDYNDT